MRLLGPISRLLGKELLAITFGVLLLIEAVFLAESFTSLLERTLRYDGSASDMAFVLLLKMPEIFDFGLPLALLFGCYFAITHARDDSALVVCAAAGLSWKRVLGFVITVGIGGALTSLVISLSIAPNAAFVQRLYLANLQREQIMLAITTPNPQSRIQTIKGVSFITRPPPKGETGRGQLFVYQPTAGRAWHVSQAEDWQITGPDSDNNHAITLTRFRDYRGRAPEGSNTTNTQDNTGAISALPDVSTVAVNRLALDFNFQDILEAAETLRRSDEKPLLAIANAFDGERQADTRRRAGELLSRALMCLSAVLMALAAATFARDPLRRLIALPTAASLLLFLDVALRMILGDMAVLGSGALTLTTALGIAGVTLPQIAVIAHQGEAMIRPATGRA